MSLPDERNRAGKQKRRLSAAGLEVPAHRPALRQPAGRLGPLLPRPGRNAVQPVHHRQLLRRDGAVPRQQSVRDEHELLPALRDKRYTGGPVPADVLHLEHLHPMDRVRGHELRDAVLLNGERGGLVIRCLEVRHSRVESTVEPNARTAADPGTVLDVVAVEHAVSVVYDLQLLLTIDE